MWNTQQQSSEVQLLIKALSYVRTHWWIYVLECCALFAVSLYKFHRAPNIYESRAAILIDNKTTDLYQSVFLSVRRHDTKRQNLGLLFRSQEVMDKFRDHFIEFFNKQGRPKHLNAYFINGVAVPSGQFGAWVNLNWERSSDTYDLRCTAPNPDAAHDLCLIYMNTLTEIYPKFGQRPIIEKRNFLQEQVKLLTQQILDYEQKMNDFEKQNPDFIRYLTGVVENKSLRNLRNELLNQQQQARRNVALKQLFTDIMKDNSKNQGNFLDMTLSALRNRLSDLQYKKFLTEHSSAEEKEARLQTVSKEIEFVSTQIQKLTDQEFEATRSFLPVESIRNKLNALEFDQQMTLITIRELGKEIELIEDQNENFRQMQMEYKRLLAEIDHKKNVLGKLYTDTLESEIELTALRSEIFNLVKPNKSDHRISPQLTKYIFSALSLSVFTILVTTILLIAFFPRLDSESDIVKLNLPILGKIPVLKDWMGSIHTIAPFNLEYLKIMNYRIRRETKETKCPIVIVTSPQAGEGKSTVTYFLTLTSQSPNAKCLFVDGDLLTSEPNCFFDIPEDTSAGLKYVLDNPGQDVDISSLVVPTKYEGIHFLPRGGKIDSVSSPNLLQPISKLFERMKNDYDIIFVDTPPLFTSSLSHQWAGLGNLIVFVARMYLTRPRDILEAIQTCKIYSRAHVGVVVNCMPMFSQPRRGYYYYFSKRKLPKLAA